MNKRPELDTTNPPGQIVNPIPKQECEKLTFDEWYKENRTSATSQIIISGMTFEEWLFFAWEAGQENK